MSDLHTKLESACKWRLERWPTDRSVAHMVFTDMLSVPSPDDFRRAIDQAGRRGAVAVRTSALFPRSQRAAVEAGFEPIDTLTLLRLTIDAPTERRGISGLRRQRSPTSPLRHWQLMAAADIDRLSFGDEWANSTISLQRILRATERARARVTRDPSAPRSRIDGFVISGISDATGYIQRLAVHPNRRGAGRARSLVADSIDWMRRHDVTTVFVNTGLDNHAALGLYRSFGFVDTGEVLTINERRPATPWSPTAST